MGRVVGAGVVGGSEVSDDGSTGERLHPSWTGVASALSEPFSDSRWFTCCPQTGTRESNPVRNVKGLTNQSIGGETASRLGSLQREEGREVCTSEWDLLLQLQFQDIFIVKSLELCSILPPTREIRDPLRVDFFLL